MAGEDGVGQVVEALATPLALVPLAVGLGVVGATVSGAMLASASYIAAPASVRASLPEADAGRCITASLGLTFPFNLALGIPTYAAFAGWLGR